MRRLISFIARPQPGIALAPILMVVALLAILVAAFSQGANLFGGSAVNSDRIVFELRGQMEMIRAKIEECAMVTRRPGLPGVPVYLFPGDDQQGTPLKVTDLACPRDAAGQQNLWVGARPAILPPQPRGFMPWVYVNHGDPDDSNTTGNGGICIAIQPETAVAASAATTTAIRRAMKQYAPGEYEYSESDPAQRIIFWVRHPRSGNQC